MRLELVEVSNDFVEPVREFLAYLDPEVHIVHGLKALAPLMPAEIQPLFTDRIAELEEHLRELLICPECGSDMYEEQIPFFYPKTHYDAKLLCGRCGYE